MGIHITKYWLKAKHRKGHGVHSPFAFTLVREVLYNCYGNYSAFAGDKRANAVLFSFKKHSYFLMRLTIFLKERNIRRVDVSVNAEQLICIKDLYRTADWDTFWKVLRDDRGALIDPEQDRQCFIIHRPYASAETRWLVNALYRGGQVEVAVDLRKLWLGFRYNKLQHQHYTILF